MYSEDDLLPISGLQHLFFCRRRAALVHGEGLWENNVYTAEGSIIHENVDLDGFETRKDLRYTTGLRIRSLRLGLIGRADLIEFHRIDEHCKAGVKIDGVSGLWLPCPVEYKHGEKREEEEYEVQLCAQALCLEEMLGVRIDSGYIFYAASKRRVEVVFNNTIRDKTEKGAQLFREVLASPKLPSPEYSKKCKFCSMFDICMPGLVRKTSAKQYIEKMINDSKEHSCNEIK